MWEPKQPAWSREMGGQAAGERMATSHVRGHRGSSAQPISPAGGGDHCGRLLPSRPLTGRSSVPSGSPPSLRSCCDVVRGQLPCPGLSLCLLPTGPCCLRVVLRSDHPPERSSVGSCRSHRRLDGRPDREQCRRAPAAGPGGCDIAGGPPRSPVRSATDLDRAGPVPARSSRISQSTRTFEPHGVSNRHDGWPPGRQPGNRQRQHPRHRRGSHIGDPASSTPEAVAVRNRALLPSVGDSQRGGGRPRQPLEGQEDRAGSSRSPASSAADRPACGEDPGDLPTSSSSPGGAVPTTGDGSGASTLELPADRSCRQAVPSTEGMLPGGFRDRLHRSPRRPPSAERGLHVFSVSRLGPQPGACRGCLRGGPALSSPPA